jgi:hypothetical protein
MIFSKIFFGVLLAQKNYKMQKSELANAAGIRKRPVAVAGFRPETFGSGLFWPDPTEIFRIWPNQWQDPVISGRNLPDPARSMAGSCHIRPDQWPNPSRAGWIPAVLPSSGNIPVGIWWPASGAGRIPVTECCRTPAPVGF